MDVPGSKFPKEKSFLEFILKYSSTWSLFFGIIGLNKIEPIFNISADIYKVVAAIEPLLLSFLISFHGDFSLFE